MNHVNFAQFQNFTKKFKTSQMEKIGTTALEEIASVHK